MKKKRGVLALVDRFSSNGASFQRCSSVTYDGSKKGASVSGCAFGAHSYSSFISVVKTWLEGGGEGRKGGRD